MKKPTALGISRSGGTRPSFACDGFHKLSGLVGRLRRSPTGPGRAEWDADDIGRLPKNRRFAAACKRYSKVPAFFNRATIEKQRGKAKDPL
ncbi:MAG: hypothetical protein ACREYE_27490 [Gammaproteobacteria bacterium]